jgi:hypothetical protein
VVPVSQTSNFSLGRTHKCALYSHVPKCPSVPAHRSAHVLSTTHTRTEMTNASQHTATHKHPARCLNPKPAHQTPRCYIRCPQFQSASSAPSCADHSVHAHDMEMPNILPWCMPACPPPKHPCSSHFKHPKRMMLCTPASSPVSATPAQQTVYKHITGNACVQHGQRELPLSRHQYVQ